MKRITYIVSFLLISLSVPGQRYGGICIADSMTEAHESAMLHIISTNKGLLLPTATRAELDKIKPLTPGLTVYVIDSGKGGFQYWNGEDWIRLEVINEQKIAMIAPLGGIIMYHGNFDNFDANGKGLIGTEMEGWQLCNGKNGAPDLSSEFVVGGGRESDLDSDDEKYLKIGEGRTIPKKFSIKKENMPAHSHSVDSSVTIKHNHNHTVTSSNKDTLKGKTKEYDNSHSHLYNTKIHGSRKKGREFSRKNAKKEEHVKTKNLSKTLDLNQFEVKYYNADVEFTVDSRIVKENNGDDYSFDNRPKYYVLAFIIRVDDNIDEGGYDGKYTIDY